jgi:uncharacterized iron-regulated protein
MTRNVALARHGSILAALVAAYSLRALAAPVEIEATPTALAATMHGHAVVLLGEVHDNAAQHALRAAALRLLVESGARPAIAFEQFDRQNQDAIDRARRERPGNVDYLIAQAKGSSGWKWELYKPYIQLALDYELPIVAANLSRAAAMKAASSDGKAGAALPAAFFRAHQAAIASGHCDLIPATALPGMARAQIARDRILAESIAPYAARGVVLLTGNGHVRNDIGVPYWLSPAERAKAVSIALLERGENEVPRSFDAYVMTDRASRPDPCEELRQRMKSRN